MPSHKQAEHTTVLTKRPQTLPENACNAGAIHTLFSGIVDAAVQLTCVTNVPMQ
jgi:hypothetical protein